MHNRHGLLPLTHDRTKDFTVGALFDLPKIEDLPADFTLGAPKIRDQGQTDLCSAYASTTVSTYQEGVELSPLYQFAKTKQVMGGDPSAWGADLKSACKSLVEYGSVEQSYMDMQQDMGWDLRDGTKWPKQFDEKAKAHKKQAYLAVKGPYDSFDDIRATIYRFRSEGRAILIGVEFGWSLTDARMEHPQEGYGHAMAVYGWRTFNGVPYLMVANSYGMGAGENGTHYFSREVINKYIDIYGAYMTVDQTREDIEYMLENKIKFDHSAIGNLLTAIWNFIKDLVRSPVISNEEKSAVLQTVYDAVETLQTPPKPVKHDTAWCGGPLEERLKMYDLAVSICKEQGMGAMTQDVLATIYGESGFNQWCENTSNKDGTADYGICQFNTGTNSKGQAYWIGKGGAFPSVEFVLNNPENCIREMCRQFKQGNQNYWVAYKGRAKFFGVKPH